jgi:hypothetical protein
MRIITSACLTGVSPDQFADEILKDISEWLNDQGYSNCKFFVFTENLEVRDEREKYYPRCKDFIGDEDFYLRRYFSTVYLVESKGDLARDMSRFLELYLQP